MGATGPIIVHTSEAATTVIAALGLALALLSLVWQAWSFRLAGSRVGVEVRSGLLGPQGYVTVAGAAPAAQLDMLRAQGFTTPVIGVRVTNAGRGATSISSVGVRFENGAAYENPAVEPSLSFRLEGEHEQTWHFDGQQITASAHALGTVFADEGSHTIRGFASIAGRQKSIASKSLIRLR